MLFPVRTLKQAMASSLLASHSNMAELEGSLGRFQSAEAPCDQVSSLAMRMMRLIHHS